MSCLQTLVALSSGEAEYYALIRGACTSLGIQSHYQDWMIDVPIQIYNDSAAARSVARRCGIGGRLRHLQTRHSCLKSRVALGHLKLDVVAGEQNPAHSRNHCQVARFASGQNMLVKDGCSNRSSDIVEGTCSTLRFSSEMSNNVTPTCICTCMGKLFPKNDFDFFVCSEFTHTQCKFTMYTCFVAYVHTCADVPRHTADTHTQTTCSAQDTTQTPHRHHALPFQCDLESCLNKTNMSGLERW